MEDVGVSVGLETHTMQGHTRAEHDEDTSELSGVVHGCQGTPVVKVEYARSGVRRAHYDIRSILSANMYTLARR